MTDDDLQKIFKANLDDSQAAALRGLYNAGYYEGAGITPAATSPDVSKTKSLPVAIVNTKRK